MALIRVTPLDGDSILPLADAKDHLRVLHSDEDDVIAALRNAAIGHVERVSGIALSSGDWRWTMRNFPARVDLPMGPVTALGDVTYYDSEGVEQTYADARLIGASVYPDVSGVFPTAYDYATVEFTAGLASLGDAEADLLAAVKVQLEILWDRGMSAPEIIAAKERCVRALIGTYQAVLV